MDIKIEQEKVFHLQLARSLSPMQYYLHLKNYGSAARAIKHVQFPRSMDDIKQEITLTHDFGAEFIFNFDKTYPVGLKQITTPPPVLVVKGKKELLARSGVSIIGSRQASLPALKLAEMFAKDLGINGQVIVSGLALGVDTAAHKGSISTGTIAVLGCGINVDYPLENKELQVEIGEKGLVVTEFPFNYPVKRESFPARNRIIAGLTWGTVVVEAGMKSGSMITAKHALAQGRDVFAVPGNPLDTRARGCNFLIKDGAVLTESYQDILNHYQKVEKQVVNFEVEEEDVNFENAQEQILSLLSSTPVYIDEIVRYTTLPSKIVRSVLIDLELENKVHIDQANKVFKID